ncbi:MAG: 50S ribosomal protein L32 [Candidatus Moeniiplasma glomeromycotorum]|nr:50S ribosomal protein L32 [Candidatus Moeniiplasma glomeromycotorum]MCE8169973.1 50S ribosomal protein L32 [Candidatus Moeniiplasma glomeromycotorum]
MAVPAQRRSPARVKRSRGPKKWSFQQAFRQQPLVKCINCQQTKLLHHRCPNCLIYRTSPQPQKITKK